MSDPHPETCSVHCSYTQDLTITVIQKTLTLPWNSASSHHHEIKSEISVNIKWPIHHSHGVSDPGKGGNAPYSRQYNPPCPTPNFITITIAFSKHGRAAPRPGQRESEVLGHYDGLRSSVQSD